ncbi:nSTAND3 domain-containing NTPase [Salegentibacter agarivorans]
MSGRLQDIENRLHQINSARFQNLCDTYLVLREREFTSIERTGSQFGKEKTVKGTPDSFIRLSNNKLGYVEHTTQSSSLPEKMKEDIDKCLDGSITKVASKQIDRIIICFNGRLKTAQEVKIQEYAQSKNIKLELIGVDTLALEILSKYLLLAREFLDIKLETGQIQTLSGFIAEYNNKANNLSTPLDNVFLHRENELKQINDAINESDLVIISGAAGVGKTKIALKSIDQFLEQNTSYTPYVIVKKDVDIYEDLKIQLQQDNDYILFVDDANRQLINLQQLFGVFKEVRKGKIKLVLTVRNYALTDILKESFVFDNETIDIPKFSDEEIVQLLESESFGIQNSKYQKKIVELSDGNARLAIMGAKIALDKQYEFLAGDVTELYDTYFKNVTSDLDIFQNKVQMQVLGLISFFFTINREDKDVIETILENFEIDYYKFNEAVEELHKKELVEVQYNHIRISEQVMATYFFYLVFIKDGLLSFDKLLFNYFDGYKHRYTDTIIPANNSFGYDKVFSKINPALDKYLVRIQNDENKTLTFLDQFWFYKPEDVLSYFGQKINNLSEPENPKYLTEYETNDFVHSKEQTLDFLTRFFRHQTESFEPAVILAFEYIRKKPEHLPEFIRRIRETLLFDERDERYGFARQSKFIELMCSRIAKGKEHFCIAFFAVSETFLQHSFHIVHGGRKHTITFYDYPIPQTKEIELLRATIWKTLFTLFDNYRSKVIKSINNFRPGYRKRTPKLLEYDLSFLIPFILENFSPQSFIESHSANDLSISLKNEDRIDGEIFNELESAFNTKAYKNFRKLDWNKFRDKEEYEFEDWREYERVKSDDLKQNFTFQSINDFPAFFDCINNSQAIIDRNHSQIEKSLEVIFEENFLQDEDIGLQLLEEYLNKNYKIRCLYRTISVIVKSSKLNSKKLWSILENWSGENSIYWKLTFFERLPSDFVNNNYYDNLKSTLKSIDCNAYLYIQEYKKFNLVKTDAIKEILYIISQKIEEGINLRTSEYPYTDGFDQLKDDYALMSKLYFQQYTLGKTSFTFDYEKKGFKNLYVSYPEFLFDFFNVFYSKYDLGRRNDNLKIGFIWDTSDRFKEISAVIEFLVDAEPYFGLGGHSVSVLFNELDTIQSKNALNFLKSYITNNQENRKQIEVIFDIIRKQFNDKFEELLLFFLDLNSNVEFFKQIDWPGNPGVQMGEVNWGVLHAKRWERILAIVEKSKMVIEIIPIKAFIKKIIQSEHNHAEHERMQKFIRPSDF